MRDFLFWLNCFFNCSQSACTDSSQTLRTAATPWCHPWRRNGTFLNWLLAQWGKAWIHTAPVYGGPRLERDPNQVIQFYLYAVFPVYQSFSQIQNQSFHFPETEASRWWWNPWCKHSRHVSCRSDWSWNWKHTEEQPVLPQRLQRLWRRAIRTNAVKQHRHGDHSSQGWAVFYTHKNIKCIINTAIIKSNRYSTQGMLCAKYLLSFNIFRV